MPQRKIPVPREHMTRLVQLGVILFCISAQTFIITRRKFLCLSFRGQFMLLICPRCQNTYTIDDQVYAQQGAVCQTCMEQLVPCQDNGYNPNAQWGQDAQWGGQQYGQDARWGGQQYGQDAQWGGQQYGQDAQWGNQPQQQYGQDAQWGGQQYGQDAQWGQQYGQDAQWGNQPQMPADAQWGNQQVMGGSASPAPDAPGNPAPVYASNERTVALDLDDISAQMPSLEAQNSASKAAAGSDNDGWGDMPAPNAAPSFSVNRSGNQVVVGSPLPAQATNGMTHQIDLKDVEEMYGDKGTFIRNFFKSLSKKHFIIAGASAGAALILFIIVTIVATRPEKIEYDINRDGEIVEKGTAERPLSFQEMVAQTKTAIPSLHPMEGERVEKGVLIGASSDAGIIYNNKKIASVDEITKSGAPQFSSAIFDAAQKDKTGLEVPFIILVDSSLSMSAVYRLMYSLGPVGRTLELGGSTSSGVTTLPVFPYEWPSHDMFDYPAESTPSVQVKVTRTDIILRRTPKNASEPLLVTAEGEKLTEVTGQILGAKIVSDNIPIALSRLKSTKQGDILITTDGDVSLGTFLNVVKYIIGDKDMPNVQRFLLETVPLR